jgi:hypothetical protein
MPKDVVEGGDEEASVRVDDATEDETDDNAGQDDQVNEELGNISNFNLK